MKSKLSILVLSFVISSLFTGWHYQEHQLSRAEWLIGKWQSNSEQGSVYEYWIKITNDEYHAECYRVNNHDTVRLESIQLIEKQHGLFYVATVNRQNNQQPVSFKLKEISDIHLLFENLEHDFPQMISYRKLGVDSIMAEISGKVGGESRKRTYVMKKIDH